MLVTDFESALAKHVIKGGSFLCSETYCSRYRPAAREAQSPDTGTSTSASAWRSLSPLQPPPSPKPSPPHSPFVADPHSLTSLDWPLDLIWVDKEATVRKVSIYIKFKSELSRLSIHMF